MDNQTAINFLDQLRKVLLDDKSWLESTIQPINEAFDKAISALQAQDSRRICNTCKHNPPSKKWPCEDCDMRESADRWEPKEAKDSTESSLTQKELDTISRQSAIDALDVLCQEHRYKIPGKRETYSQYNEAWQDALDRAEGAIGNLPSAQPEPDWTEIMVVCDNCGHIIHVKRVNVLPLGRAEGR